jgi:hypothetical protein
MKVRTGEPHGLPLEEVTTRKYTVKPLPHVDFAAEALLEAQARWFREHPNERRRASALLWDITPAD